MTITQCQAFRKDDAVEIFEVGFHQFADGCTHVLNQTTGQLEPIAGIDTFYSEGQEYTRVETYTGQWYDLDGRTQLARRQVKRESNECTRFLKVAAVNGYH